MLFSIVTVLIAPSLANYKNNHQLGSDGAHL